MTLDTPDAELLDQSITRIAHDLRELGDPDPLHVRRARAAGILADPQHALDLMSGREDAGPTHGRGGHTHLFVHLTPDDLVADLTGDTGAATIEKLGAATTDLLTRWLARFAETGGVIRVRPVLDLDQTWSVDQHDPPEAMREQVILRDAHCVFPGCRRDSRHCDLDHITEYLPTDDGGPPGQTTPSNLAPLCRTHHRVKTFTSWHFKRLHHGSYTWTSPTLIHFLLSAGESSAWHRVRSDEVWLAHLGTVSLELGGAGDVPEAGGTGPRRGTRPRPRPDDAGARPGRHLATHRPRKVVSTRTRGGSVTAVTERVASMPSTPGMRTSISTTSGFRPAHWSMASAPFAASPTTAMSSWSLRIIRRPVLTSGWSSASTTRITTSPTGTATGRVRRTRPRPVRPPPTHQPPTPAHGCPPTRGRCRARVWSCCHCS